MIPVSVTKDSIVVTIGGFPSVVPRNNSLVKEILEAVKVNDETKVKELVDRALAIKTVTNGIVEIKDGTVYYKDQPLSNAVVPKMLEMFDMGIDLKPWFNFVEKLMANPSFSSREQLYRFIEANNVAITEEGDLLLYKWVQDNYMDTHSGTISNRVGAVVEMERSSVDDDPNRTCSSGLHVCSQGYTKFGTRLMLIKVSPTDVVSVPVDYNNSKMRTCKYEVFAEVNPMEYETRDWAREPVYGYSSDNYEYDDFWDDSWDSWDDDYSW